MYDLIHSSSKDVLSNMLNQHYDGKIEGNSKHIAVLQNITQQDVDDQNLDHIGNLIIDDKLVYYKAEVKFG